jgi:hypothetical protein
MPASAYVSVIGHETNYTEMVQLRYNYRLYPAPGQRSALARAFGCARVVFNDGLRARQDAHAVGLPYITDAELSAALTTAKGTPARAWLGDVSAVILQQSVADLNTAYRRFFDYRKALREWKAAGRKGPQPREVGLPVSSPGKTAGRRSGSRPTHGSGSCPAAGCDSRRSAMWRSAGPVTCPRHRPA